MAQWIGLYNLCLRDTIYPRTRHVTYKFCTSVDRECIIDAARARYHIYSTWEDKKGTMW